MILKQIGVLCNEVSMEKICKIVYFDEESVTDDVQIVAGGELENTTELLKSRDV